MDNGWCHVLRGWRVRSVLHAAVLMMCIIYDPGIGSIAQLSKWRYHGLAHHDDPLWQKFQNHSDLFQPAGNSNDYFGEHLGACTIMTLHNYPIMREFVGSGYVWDSHPIRHSTSSAEAPEAGSH